MYEIGTDLDKARSLLLLNDVVGIPTETVYGLAGNAFSEDAALRIFEVKQRPKFDPLIVHTNSIERIGEFVTHIPEMAQKLLEQFAPGPITLLLPKKQLLPDLVTSGLTNVAVRIPKHPLTLELLASLPFPLSAPSANPFGYISPTSAKHVAEQLGKEVKYILDGGPSKVGVESTIVGFEDGKPIIYRLGGLSVEDIEYVTGKAEIRTSSSSPSAPGMLMSHYAPRKQLLIGHIPDLLEINKGKNIGILSFSEEYKANIFYCLSPKKDLNEASKNLFNYMRLLDESNIDLIIAEFVPYQGLGRAINDRLKRAAFNA
jgi:L-threonylcarbamoyladenylate synthase